MCTKNPVKNNASTNELISFLKRSRNQYKNLTKSEEREMIEKYYGKDDEKLQNLLVLHNIRYVFNLSKKYAQQTADFDDLIAKGLYGLVVASKKFNPYTPIMKKTPILDENGNQKFEKIPVYRERKNGETYQARDRKTGSLLFKTKPLFKEEIVFESDKVTPKYVKFNTYATSWILKYIRKEFNDEKEIKLATNTVSLNSLAKIKNTEGSETMENYIDGILSHDFPVKSNESELSSHEMTNVCKDICNFVDSDTQLSSNDKQIFFDTFYRGKKAKDIARELGCNSASITNRKNKILDKIKSMLKNKYNIKSIDDLMFGAV